MKFTKKVIGLALPGTVDSKLPMVLKSKNVYVLIKLFHKDITLRYKRSHF